MADKDRANTPMRPEQRLAQRIVDLSGLEPPIDVEALIRQVADVEEDGLPEQLDAILIRSGSTRTRPKVVISKNLRHNRKRFTFSHELAHIRLPWHVGTAWCHTEWISQVDEGIHFTTEDEANWFAASLLMPPNWLRVIVNSDVEIDEKFRSVLTAGVSPQAAAISLFDVLPPGFAYTIASMSDHTVIQSGKSRNTAIDRMHRGTLFLESFYQNTRSQHFVIDHVWSQTHLWSFEMSVDPPPVGTVGFDVTSMEILREIVESVGHGSQQDVEIRNRISAFTGHACGKYEATSPQQLLAIFLQRFHQRDGIVGDIASHSMFVQYLARRADELFRKRITPRKD